MSKLKSRKLWMSIGASLGCLLIAFCGNQDASVDVAAMIGSVISSIAYVVGEAIVDRAAVLKKQSEDALANTPFNGITYSNGFTYCGQSSCSDEDTINV